ncbi:unnamed protein product [Dicrocoelium dendriticum]|nr:unnamed protein product [Dicrocoelium dendriticum]
MTARKRPKSIRKARAIAIARQERSYRVSPHSFVFSRPGVGPMVKLLSLDVRSIFEPYTATRLKVHRRNVLKDFVAVAGPLHVTHLLQFTHPRADKRAEKRARRLARLSNSNADLAIVSTTDNNGQSTQIPDCDATPTDEFGKRAKDGVYMHLVRVPHGPSLTFSVSEYCLQRDVLTLVRRIFDSHQFSTPPLLAMTGFGSLSATADSKKSAQPPPPHLRLIVDMFQNMLPPLNVQKLKLSTVRRVVLISREVDMSCPPDEQDFNDVIYLRHYHIRTENRTISRALRKLSVGCSRSKRRRMNLSDPNARPIGTGMGPGGSGKSSGVPSLAKYACIEDFLTKTGMLSDSGLSDALSDMEEVELPRDVRLPDSIDQTHGSTKKRKFVPSHGLRHLGTARTATVRLTEIGPRLTLKLIKIEEGLNSGAVLYHRWQRRTPLEIAKQAERLRQREAIRAARRAEHEARRTANEAAREAHREACLEGMKRAGQLPDDGLKKEEEEVGEDVQPVKRNKIKAKNTVVKKKAFDELRIKKNRSKKRVKFHPLPTE